jgi:hypothetical protein
MLLDHDLLRRLIPDENLGSGSELGHNRSRIAMSFTVWDVSVLKMLHDT